MCSLRLLLLYVLSLSVCYVFVSYDCNKKQRQTVLRSGSQTCWRWKGRTTIVGMILIMVLIRMPMVVTMIMTQW